MNLQGEIKQEQNIVDPHLSGIFKLINYPDVCLGTNSSSNKKVIHLSGISVIRMVVLGTTVSG